MTRSVLILLIIVLAVLAGSQIIARYRGRLAAGPKDVPRSGTALAASSVRTTSGADQDLMAELRREVKSLQAAGTSPGDPVVKSLSLITAKLSEIDRRLRSLEQRAEREDYRQKMLDKH